MDKRSTESSLLSDYATYFVKWVQAFNAEGIDIYAVTPQNEPLNRGNSASLYMSWEEQRDFVKTALGPKFKTAGLATKIYAYDHNYDYSDIATEKNYPGKMYEDAAASQYLPELLVTTMAGIAKSF